jgi:hypothetical protein
MVGRQGGAGRDGRRATTPQVSIDDAGRIDRRRIGRDETMARHAVETGKHHRKAIADCIHWNMVALEDIAEDFALSGLRTPSSIAEANHENHSIARADSK